MVMGGGRDLGMKVLFKIYFSLRALQRDLLCTEFFLFVCSFHDLDASIN